MHLFLRLLAHLFSVMNWYLCCATYLLAHGGIFYSFIAKHDSDFQDYLLELDTQIIERGFSKALCRISSEILPQSWFWKLLIPKSATASLLDHISLSSLNSCMVTAGLFFHASCFGKQLYKQKVACAGVQRNQVSETGNITAANMSLGTWMHREHLSAFLL